MTRSEDPEIDLRAMEAALGMADPDLPPVPADRAAELLAAEAYWSARFAPLADAAPRVRPSAALWRRIAADTRAPAPARRAAARGRPGVLARLWSFLGLGPLSAFAAAAASVIVVALAGAPQPVLVAILQSPDGAQPGFALVVEADRTVRLRALGDAAVPADRALEFWTKADTDPLPISLGLLDPDEPAAIPFPGTLPAPGQLFEISLEPATGSPTGLPTGPVLFIGRAVPGDAI